MKKFIVILLLCFISISLSSCSSSNVQIISQELLNKKLSNCKVNDNVLLYSMNTYSGKKIIKQVNIYGYVNKLNDTKIFLKYGPVARWGKGDIITYSDNAKITSSGGLTYKNYNLNLSYTIPFQLVDTLQKATTTGIYQIKLFQHTKNINITNLCITTYEKGKWSNTWENKNILYNIAISANSQADFQSNN